jgi:hypothetical protein
VQSNQPAYGNLRYMLDGWASTISRVAVPMRAGRSGEGIFGVAIVALVGSVVVAFLSINQSSQVASTGFDIRELDNTRGRLEREEQRLASEGAQLRAFGRIESEATTRLGMIPAPSPDYVRARRAPIDIDARLREAEARARSQQPTIDDRVSQWFHLSVIDHDQPESTGLAVKLRRAWTALTVDAPLARRRGGDTGEGADSLVAPSAPGAARGAKTSSGGPICCATDGGMSTQMEGAPTRRTPGR